MYLVDANILVYSTDEDSEHHAASPSSPRIRISPSSPASHGSIPSQPRPYDDFADPPRPHGPYYQLTRKLVGKTVTTRLTAGQAARYTEWIANQREMHRLLAEME